MRKKATIFSATITGHVVAACAALALHGGIAGWVMLPDAPQPLPQQQVIQVSMVAPSVVSQKPDPQPVVTKKVTSAVPPKTKGMLKAKPKKRQVTKTDKAPAQEPVMKEPVHTQQQTQMTSGRVSQQAKAKHSALMKPIAADYLNNPPPQYPSSARRKKQQGTVFVDVLVSALGTPKKLAIGKSSGVDVLDEAAIAAVRKWKFIPAKRGSEIVEARLLVPIRFRLN